VLRSLQDIDVAASVHKKFKLVFLKSYKAGQHHFRLLLSRSFKEDDMKNRLLMLCMMVGLAFSGSVRATDVCNCLGYAGIGGPCYSGIGGPAYAGIGGPAYAGIGGACSAEIGAPKYGGIGGPAYKGIGGPAYDGIGGPAYKGIGGPAYDGIGGPCYKGIGGPCYSGIGGGAQCPAVCSR
jgi:hypothetical protein